MVFVGEAVWVIYRHLVAWLLIFLSFIHVCHYKVILYKQETQLLQLFVYSL
jgi:hypothetical protein